MDTSIHNKLLPGEEILWEGQSQVARGINLSNLGTSIFGIIWLGFSLFWTITAFLMTRNIESADPTGTIFKNFFPLFGLPFVAIGVFMVIVAPMKQRNKNRRTFYYVTNKRIIINIDTEKSAIFNSVFIGDLKGVQTTKNRDNTGNIIFPSFFTDNGNLYRVRTYQTNSYIVSTPSNCFYRIENPDDVYQLIQMRQELVDLKESNNSNMNNKYKDY